MFIVVKYRILAVSSGYPCNKTLAQHSDEEAVPSSDYAMMTFLT